jgi:GAF domain-containing protein
LLAVGDTALAIDDIQRALGSGPAEDVVRDGRTLHVPDLMADLRWGQFGVRAADEGVLALLACPLPLPRRRAGVLSSYGARPAAFDAAAELVVPVFAARAAIAVAHADKVIHLERAVQSRQVIGQAVGILMERHRLSAQRAFATLVAYTQMRVDSSCDGLTGGRPLWRLECQDAIVLLENDHEDIRRLSAAFNACQ